MNGFDVAHERYLNKMEDEYLHGVSKEEEESAEPEENSDED